MAKLVYTKFNEEDQSYRLEHNLLARHLQQTRFKGLGEMINNIENHLYTHCNLSFPSKYKFGEWISKKEFKQRGRKQMLSKRSSEITSLFFWKAMAKGQKFVEENFDKKFVDFEKVVTVDETYKIYENRGLKNPKKFFKNLYEKLLEFLMLSEESISLRVKLNELKGSFEPIDRKDNFIGITYKKKAKFKIPIFERQNGESVFPGNNTAELFGERLKEIEKIILNRYFPDWRLKTYPKFFLKGEYIPKTNYKELFDSLHGVQRRKDIGLMYFITPYYNIQNNTYTTPLKDYGYLPNRKFEISVEFSKYQTITELQNPNNEEIEEELINGPSAQEEKLFSIIDERLDYDNREQRTKENLREDIERFPPNEDAESEDFDIESDDNQTLSVEEGNDDNKEGNKSISAHVKKDKRIRYRPKRFIEEGSGSETESDPEQVD